MILAFDVGYGADNTAKTVCAVFKDWQATEADEFLVRYLDKVEEYTPGQFYKRELPCIMEVLKDMDLSAVSAIVIDGFVTLDNENKLGLGGYLYEKLGKKVPVIGVAKSGFGTKSEGMEKVYRGESKKPLFVTTMGVGLEQTAENIRNMAGDFRMPDILKEVDTLTKQS